MVPTYVPYHTSVLNQDAHLKRIMCVAELMCFFNSLKNERGTTCCDPFQSLRKLTKYREDHDMLDGHILYVSLIIVQIK